jgi:hypothetical protein
VNMHPIAILSCFDDGVIVLGVLNFLGRSQPRVASLEEERIKVCRSPARELLVWHQVVFKHSAPVIKFALVLVLVSQNALSFRRAPWHVTRISYKKFFPVVSSQQLRLELIVAPFATLGHSHP